MAHKPPPQHLFSNLETMVPPETLSVLKQMQLDFISDAEAEEESTSSESHRKAGNSFLQAAHAFLRASRTQDKGSLTAYCILHDCHCPVIPPEVLQRRDADDESDGGDVGSSRDQTQLLWLECAGNSCTPWSAAGARRQWLDPVSVPSLIYGSHLSLCSPDLVVNENTPQWPAQMYFKLFMPAHHAISIDVCPTAMGFPCQRMRRYTVCAHSKIVSEHQIQSFEQTFRQVCTRKLCSDARIYFQAPSKVVARYLADILEKRSLDETVTVDDWKHILTVANKRRLQDLECDHVFCDHQ